MRLQALEELSISDGNGEFWLDTSEASLEAIWGNPEDDVYAELLPR